MQLSIKKNLSAFLLAFAAVATPSLQAQPIDPIVPFDLNEVFPDIVVNPDAPVEFPVNPQAIIGETLVELFEQEAIYARAVASAIINGAPTAAIDALNARLTQNALDISNFIAQFFPNNPQLFTQLAIDLAEYVVLEEAFTVALVAGNTAQAQAILTQWQAQGDAIADLISSLDPSVFSDAVLRSLFDQHTQTEAFQIAFSILGNYTASIQLFDQSRAQMMHIGAYIARGIDREFVNQSSSHHHH
ncbi:hypothetical protein [Candidatus Protochlamydia phocaeensis]|uniref:hypothetical protein n=1 Tax=Candidatus Protochlamydia phocaeensis TaxID=1414722 RepID=UPI0008389BEC|nr:hypothetical protein [Candidatus Protochlamydia phocaeensis]